MPSWDGASVLATIYYRHNTPCSLVASALNYMCRAHGSRRNGLFHGFILTVDEPNLDGLDERADAGEIGEVGEIGQVGDRGDSDIVGESGTKAACVHDSLNLSVFNGMLFASIVSREALSSS
jgi:hypothetical protein